MAKRFIYRRPWTYPKQNEAIFYPVDSRGDRARYGLIEASTKTGKTVGCIAWLFEKALFGRPGEHYWWIAPVHRQAAIAWRRMSAGAPPQLVRKTHMNSSITLVSGAVVDFLSGENPDNLYGEDVFAAVMDEASRAREEAFLAVRSTLTATRGDFRAIGNVKGRKNWFYSLCRRAEGGERNMCYRKIIAADAVAAGVLSAEEIEDARRIMPEQAFKELYLAEPSDDGGNPFGLKHIEACYGPMSRKDPWFWGWDLAKSNDWTVGIGLDDEGKVCRFHRFQAPWPETTDRIRRETGVITPALVDSTGVGDPILDTLQKGSSNFVGFKFSAPSKQKIMEGLAVTIQNRATQFPPSEVSPNYASPAHLAKELEEFEYQYTRTGVRYSAPEGFHDDTVCALALADECRRAQGDLATWIRMGQMQ